LQSLVHILEQSTYVKAESEDLPKQEIPALRIGPNYKMTYRQLVKRHDLRTNPLTSDLYYEDIFYMSKMLTEETLDSLEENSHRKTSVRFESALVLQNLEDSASKEIMGETSQRVLSSSLDDKLFLDDFFKRPVLISSAPIALNTDFDNNLNPWLIWSSIPAIRNKLAHYTYFRGNLKLRFNLSTTKFHYGSLLVSYQPMPAANRNYLVHKGLAVTTDSRKFRQNYLSQSPEICYVNAGQDDDVQLNLPFVYPHQQLRLFNDDSVNILDNTIPYNDFQSFGEIFITSLGQFHSQTIDTLEDPPFLSIYAWMDDVELSTPTNTRITVQAESEFLTNPVSSIATAVSHVAERLEDVPIVSTFAKATNIAATAISKIALMFGYSKPVNVEPPKFAKQVTFSNGATVIGTDTAYKLTCDPKQELALMNDICGSGNHDALAIKHMTSIPTLIDTFKTGNIHQPYKETFIEFPVTPMLGTRLKANVTEPQFQCMQYSALSQAAMHFSNWRGTISFRFDVTASNFTRGKLLFIYEPNGTTSFIDRRARPTILNQQYMVTMDLEKERSITIHVGFNHHKSFANVHDFFGSFTDSVKDYLHPTGGTDSVILANNRGCATGVLSVRNATTLTGLENPTTPLYIHTYVYSNDIEFTEPKEIGFFVNASSTVTAESAYEQGEPLNKVQRRINNTVTVTGKEITINTTKPSNHDIFTAHYGEKIESLRVLLKRDQASIFTLLVASQNTTRHSIYPEACPRLVPRSVPISGSQGNISTFNIMRYCYLGSRGGMRWRTYGPNDHFVGPVVISYQRNQSLALTNFETVINTGTIGNASPSGSIVVNPLHGGIEYEVPYFHDHLFTSTCDHLNADRYDRDITTPCVTLFYTSPGNYGRRYFNFAIAEDFNFIRFQGACFYVST
jgi:hypothetical protein